MSDTTGNAIRASLISANEMDRNFENANVVDGLFAIARGLQAIATAINDSDNGGAMQSIAGSLGDIAFAIEQKT